MLFSSHHHLLFYALGECRQLAGVWKYIHAVPGNLCLPCSIYRGIDFVIYWSFDLLGSVLYSLFCCLKVSVRYSFFITLCRAQPRPTHREMHYQQYRPLSQNIHLFFPPSHFFVVSIFIAYSVLNVSSTVVFIGVK